ncbi:hypothetical protein B0T09DRAFT_323880 [Sordaria sp. MPI-SDFR-AT-0083]|nr:hypothetical protein B0T09DRAFT_323880 [Sordaria sp. MPI-SDFR-AT-0083]
MPISDCQASSRRNCRRPARTFGGRRGISLLQGFSISYSSQAIGRTVSSERGWEHAGNSQPPLVTKRLQVTAGQSQKEDVRHAFLLLPSFHGATYGRGRVLPAAGIVLVGRLRSIKYQTLGKRTEHSNLEHRSCPLTHGHIWYRIDSRIPQSGARPDKAVSASSTGQLRSSAPEPKPGNPETGRPYGVARTPPRRRFGRHPHSHGTFAGGNLGKWTDPIRSAPPARSRLRHRPRGDRPTNITEPASPIREILPYEIEKNKFRNMKEAGAGKRKNRPITESRKMAEMLFARNGEMNDRQKTGFRFGQCPPQRQVQTPTKH